MNRNTRRIYIVFDLLIIAILIVSILVSWLTQRTIFKKDNYLEHPFDNWNKTILVTRKSVGDVRFRLYIKDQKFVSQPRNTFFVVIWNDTRLCIDYDGEPDDVK